MSVVTEAHPASKSVPYENLRDMLGNVFFYFLDTIIPKKQQKWICLCYRVPSSV